MIISNQRQVYMYININHFYSFKSNFVGYSGGELGLKQKVDRNATMRKNISCQNWNLFNIMLFNALPRTPNDII